MIAIRNFWKGLVLGLLFLPAVALAERMELVTYYPAAVGGGSGGTANADRLHADRMTVGPGYGAVPDNQVPNGMLFVQERLGVGMPIVGGQLMEPSFPLHLFGPNQPDTPALAVDRGAPNEDFQGILIWAEDRDAFIRYEEDASEATPGRLHLQTSVAGGPVNDALVIDGLGRVGVGTANPAASLHVTSGAGTLPATDPSAVMIIQGNRQVDQDAGLWILSAPDGTGRLQFGDDGAWAAGGIRFDHAADRLQLEAGGSPAMTLRQTTPGPTVGIGVDSPEATLQVAGGVYFTGGNGDFDGNGAVNTGDINAVVSRIRDGQIGGLSPAVLARIDFNGDGRVNTTDVAMQDRLVNGGRTLAQVKALGKSLEGGALGVDLAGNVVIGGVPQPPDKFASAKLAINSMSLGFLPPRLTTNERDRISNPIGGLMVYNRTTGRYNIYNDDAGVWEVLGGGGGGGGVGTFGPPDWDSGWQTVPAAAVADVTLNHNLGTTDLYVFLENRNTANGLGIFDFFSLSGSFMGRSKYSFPNNNRIEIHFDQNGSVWADPFFDKLIQHPKQYRVRLWRIG
ncbi:MAG: hypothetical protein COV76_05075 [Candidatus Omnitrophica bacterium CG11_big_fil_rev_8_21_14_0_20_64_10]|nr:MAG: hypothetical protein COV76_05075 [Candidatus Omnitrophica bacterium CG11_big_fil_rev_8_21_14_0_20_64_10]